MPKTPSQKTRDMEARRRQRGLRELRLWVPDLAEVVEDMRDRAAMHRERAAREIITMSILNLKPDHLYVLVSPDGHEIEFTEHGARQAFEAICNAVMDLKDGEEIVIKAFAQ